MPALSVTEVSLSAGQAAGTTAVLAANPNRTSLYIGHNSASDARIQLEDASDGYGMPFPTKTVLHFGGGNPHWPICPTQAVFIGGLAAADKVTIWES